MSNWWQKQPQSGKHSFSLSIIVLSLPRLPPSLHLPPIHIQQIQACGIRRGRTGSGGCGEEGRLLRVIVNSAPALLVVPEWPIISHWAKWHEFININNSSKFVFSGCWIRRHRPGRIRIKMPSLSLSFHPAIITHHTHLSAFFINFHLSPAPSSLFPSISTVLSFCLSAAFTYLLSMMIHRMGRVGGNRRVHHFTSFLFRPGEYIYLILPKHFFYTLAAAFLLHQFCGGRKRLLLKSNPVTCHVELRGSEKQQRKGAWLLTGGLISSLALALQNQHIPSPFSSLFFSLQLFLFSPALWLLYSLPLFVQLLSAQTINSVLWLYAYTREALGQGQTRLISQTATSPHHQR